MAASPPSARRRKASGDVGAAPPSPADGGAGLARVKALRPAARAPSAALTRAAPGAAKPTRATAEGRSAGGSSSGQARATEATGVAASPSREARVRGSRKRAAPKAESGGAPRDSGVVDPSPKAQASSTPTRSRTPQTGAEERSTVARVVGLDLGAKISYCEIKDEQVVERGSATGVAELVRWLGPNTPPARVAFEACREAWAVHDQLEAWGHEPLMIDTTRVRQLGIGQHKRKTDRIDAETIARALEVGRIPLAHVLSSERRELRLQLSVRRALVETRAQYAVTIRGLVRAQGKRLPSCSPENLPSKVREGGLDDRTRLMTEPLVKLLEEATPQIVEVESKLAQLCSAEPVIARLGTAPGVGLIVAAAFVSVIDDAKRFRSAHEVESYLGLVPSENTSGKRKLGAITKQGNSYLRALLVEAAWCVFRIRDADDPLKRWAESVEQRRGRRIAVIAVARRLAGILWAMWRDGTAYNPAKLSRAAATGLSSRGRALLAEAEQQRLAATPTGNRRRPAAGKTSREVAMS